MVSPETNLHIYDQLIFNKAVRSFPGKRQSLQQTGLGKLGIYIQKNEVGPLLDIVCKINSKWIKDLNVRVKSQNS